jgi:hypothetical protein
MNAAAGASPVVGGKVKAVWARDGEMWLRFGTSGKGGLRRGWLVGRLLRAVLLVSSISLV